MTNELKQHAEALVKCGFSDEWELIDINHSGIGIPHIRRKHDFYDLVDPFADTLQSRRQANALEDWLTWIHDELWRKSFAALDDPTCGTGQTHHQWRLDRIKWCFKELNNE